MSSPLVRRGLPISMSTLKPLGYGFQLLVPAQIATPNDLCCVDFVFSLLSLHVYFCVGRHIGFRSKEPCKTLHAAGQSPVLSRLSNILTNINPSRWMPIFTPCLFCSRPSCSPLASERVGPPPFSDFTACFADCLHCYVYTKPGY